uniref:LysM domain-containing protein n=1 Tax=Lutzomyia longipalpis TaxID=7200 RepID=A0A1B0GHB0_LUTLO
MEEDFEQEKLSISRGRAKKYGSTCNHVRNTDILVRHEVEKSDTLQGIALKYGCTTEQIRRANRLYASDSLFLRQYLMVPVERNSRMQHQKMIVLIPCRPRDPPHWLKTAQLIPMQIPAAPWTTWLCRRTKRIAGVSMNFSEIDSTIAESRKYVKKSQNSIDFLSPDCVDGDGVFSP